MTFHNDININGSDTYILRYRVGEWRVSKTFRSAYERAAFREHIVRVYGAKIIK